MFYIVVSELTYFFYYYSDIIRMDTIKVQWLKIYNGGMIKIYSNKSLDLLQDLNSCILLNSHERKLK